MGCLPGRGIARQKTDLSTPPSGIMDESRAGGGAGGARPMRRIAHQRDLAQIGVVLRLKAQRQRLWCCGQIGEAGE